jgi:hypothetical protein
MKTVDELAVLIEKQGAEQAERLDGLASAVRTATDEIQRHNKRIETLEQWREGDQRRLTAAESASALVSQQIGTVTQAVARIEQETCSQSAILKMLETDKIARDAVTKAESARRGHIFQAIGVAIALLTMIGGGVGWLITQHQAERAAQQAPAVVAPH